jgi:hypothetical protein
MEPEKADCPICGKKYLKMRMADHLLSYHRDQASPKLMKKWRYSGFSYAIDESGSIKKVRPIKKSLINSIK